MRRAPRLLLWQVCDLQPVGVLKFAKVDELTFYFTTLKSRLPKALILRRVADTTAACSGLQSPFPEKPSTWNLFLR
jgi:hypothetical protein